MEETCARPRIDQLQLGRPCMGLEYGSSSCPSGRQRKGCRISRGIAPKTNGGYYGGGDQPHSAFLYSDTSIGPATDTNDAEVS